MFGVGQLLDTLNFLGGAASLDSFLEAYKIPATKRCSPCEGLNDPKKLNITQLPPYKTFFSKLRHKSPLEKDNSNIQSLLDWALTFEKALSKLKMKRPPATGKDNYQNLASVWEQENMRTLKELYSWCNNKDVVSTVEAMQ